MNQKDLISIIVPVYNVKDYLFKSVQSILNQDYNNIEIILIDDGSIDGSSELCDELAKSDSRIKVIHKENGGPSSSRNKGLDIASGKYIAFIDSDDLVSNKFISTLYSDITSEEDIDLSICNFSTVIDGNRNTFEDGSIAIFNKDDAINNILIGNRFAGHLCNKLFNRDLIGELRLDESLTLYEDLDFVIRYVFKCRNVIHHSIALYDYMIRNNSVFYSSFNERQLQTIKSCLQIDAFLKNHDYKKHKKYIDAAIVIAHFDILDRLTYDKANKKKYLKTLKKGLKERYNKGSKELLEKNRKQRIFLMLHCYNLYSFLLKHKVIG